MNPEDIGRILDEIGERIGPAGEYAWTITVKQVFIDSGVGLVIGAVLLLLSIALIVFGLRSGNVDAEEVARILDAKAKEESQLYPHTWQNYFDANNVTFESAGTALAAFLVGICGVVVALIVLAFNATPILNPEYHAMIRLLDRVLP